MLNGSKMLISTTHITCIFHTINDISTTIERTVLQISNTSKWISLLNTANKTNTQTFKYIALF